MTKSQVMQFCANVCSQTRLRRQDCSLILGTELVRHEKEKDLEGCIWKVFIWVLILDKVWNKSICHWNNKTADAKAFWKKVSSHNKMWQRNPSHPFLTEGINWGCSWVQWYFCFNNGHTSWVMWVSNSINLLHFPFSSSWQSNTGKHRATSV